ncbi:MAG TPA: Crp/Fnr family transcriptional regulator [Flavobacterium sp.]|nr:Crp/Fnr family transcriptional regulator [Flavobacterium sp.]
MYFIKKGIVRAYAPMPDREVTFWFGSEGATVVSMNSYVNNKPSYETIELLEDCILYQINSETLQNLYKTDIEIANWGRKFAEDELIKSEERLISLQFKSAKERYLDLIQHHPNLIQRVALGHIASYLGITQVSLSRIRADIK